MLLYRNLSHCPEAYEFGEIKKRPRGPLLKKEAREGGKLLREGDAR